MVDPGNILTAKRLDPSHAKWILAATALILLCFALGLTHLWQGTADPRGELFNKREWSLVQVLDKEWRGKPATIVALPHVLNSPDYDAIVLPRLDGQGSVAMLSNAVGIPGIKAFFDAPLQHICPSDYQRITASVRVNRDVDALLRALTKQECAG